MPSPLVSAAATSRDRLLDHEREAAVVSFPSLIRDSHIRIDSLLSSSSRHVAAIEAVLLDATRRHLGSARARQLGRACHELQLDLRTVQARLYGSSQTMHLSWRCLWESLDRSLRASLALEQEVAAELTAALTEDELRGLAARLAAAEQRAPTRPHPYLPRRGLRGRVARRIAHGADTFWDGVQGRVPPGLEQGGAR